MSIGRRQLLSAALAGVSLPLAGCDWSNPPLRAADTHPRSHPAVQAVEFFAQRLAAVSELGLKVYPSGQLGGQAEVLELAQFGGIDVVRVNLAPLNVFAPQTVVPVLPFIFRSTAHMRKAMDGAPGQAILDSLYDHGLVGLCYYDSGARSFYTRQRLIHHPNDLVGLKIRVQTSDIFVQMVEALGGDATPMSYGEVYQGMMQGVIDGAENNWPSYQSSRHFEVAPYFSQTEHVMAPEILAVSLSRWKKWTPQTQEIVRQCAQESVGYMRDLWDEAEVTAERSLRAQGVEVAAEVDHAAFSARMTDLWARYSQEPTMARLIEDIQAVSA